jgi:hypothetical protein
MSEGVPVAKKTSKTAAPTFPHHCVTFDDGRGHKWYVPFDEVGSVPRVGEEVFLPNPPGADKRHSVVSVQYQFVQREGPEGANGIPVRRAETSMYARLFGVAVTIR